MFQPKTEGGAPATAAVDESGSYEAMTGAKHGLKPGEYVVTVSVVKTLPPKREGDPPWAERLSPVAYNSSRTSGLAVTVEPGSNTYDIALDSAPKKK